MAVLFLVSTVAAFAETAKSDVAAAVSEGKSVTLEYSVSLADDEVVFSTAGQEPLTFIQGSGKLFPDLEKALEGMKAGEAKTVELSPEQSFGPVNPQAIVDVEKSKLPPQAHQIDAMVTTTDPNGQTFRGRVVGLEGEIAKVDFNHPLAGKTVFFKLNVLQVN
ncbi:FKBP-type peptidyl-prolyl cis-trans isomerase [uncultured Desulfuromonas sp.]|uniref:FKBP-type peptidyl-prolyl cis-trans isomerase n=1 Tax=uncultured Desulfuromonas sp. TaxID=181013 RepID=UPI0026336C96|nr:FKBP-type peptidyl-prolyl cis-trans isomerase [uncultured Desulfuromonas sp.]